MTFFIIAGLLLSFLQLIAFVVAAVWLLVIIMMVVSDHPQRFGQWTKEPGEHPSPPPIPPRRYSGNQVLLAIGLLLLVWSIVFYSLTSMLIARGMPGFVMNLLLTAVVGSCLFGVRMIWKRIRP